MRKPDYRWTMLAVTALAQVATASTSQAIPTLAAFFRADLHLSRTEIGLLNSASALGLMFSLIAAGWAADRVGSRVMILVGLTSTAFSLGMVALGQSFLQVALLLAMAGASVGIATPAIAKTIVIWFRPRERGLAMSVQRSGTPLMGALAAAILPSVALVYGWQAGVLVVAAVVAVIALSVSAVYKSGPDGYAGPQPTGTRPSSPWKLLRNRNILLASILPAVLMGVQACLVNYLVLFLTDTLVISVVIAGSCLAVAQTGGIGGRIFWGLVSDRLFRGGRRDVMLLIGTLSFVLLAIISFLPLSIPFWSVAVLAAGIGILVFGWNAIYTIFMPELAGEELAASAVGLGFTILQVGAVVGAPLFGFIVDFTGDYRWGWRTLAMAVAVGTVLLLPVKEAQSL